MKTIRTILASLLLIATQAFAQTTPPSASCPQPSSFSLIHMGTATAPGATVPDFYFWWACPGSTTQFQWRGMLSSAVTPAIEAAAVQWASGSNPTFVGVSLTISPDDPSIAHLKAASLASFLLAFPPPKTAPATVTSTGGVTTVKGITFGAKPIPVAPVPASAASQ